MDVIDMIDAIIKGNNKMANKKQRKYERAHQSEKITL